MFRYRALAVLSLSVVLAASGCTPKTPTGTAGSTNEITVKSSNDKCELSATTAEAGNLVFNVENTGSEITEFYLLGDDNKKIIGEVENIGPAISRKLVVKVPTGSFVAQCRPGMIGDGIRVSFTATAANGDAETASPADDQRTTLLAAATDAYAQFVRDESANLNAQTVVFVDAYAKKNDDLARSLYAKTRMHWERIEPVAESFGDLDPILDAREADLEPGQEWTGWHRIEKDLWPAKAQNYKPLSDGERAGLASKLVTDTETLNGRIQTLTYTPDQLGNGAKELLDEVATGKVTGEEEIWSGTDLWDFQANLEGARKAFDVLRPALVTKDKPLDAELERAFTNAQSLLDTHRSGDGFKNYADLSPDDIKKLADVVNALGEPLSKLTAAVLL